MKEHEYRKRSDEEKTKTQQTEAKPQKVTGIDLSNEYLREIKFRLGWILGIMVILIILSVLLTCGGVLLGLGTRSPMMPYIP